MNAELAQVAALVAHAKLAIATGDPSILPDLQNSTLKFVHSIGFERRIRRWLRPPRSELVASSPEVWAAHLMSRGVTAIDLIVWSANHQLAVHIAAALAGGGSWGIATRDEDGSSHWVARWNPDRREDPESRIWAVTYREFSGAPGTAASRIDAAATELRRLLAEAEALARDGDLSPWTEWFAGARAKLDADAPAFEYHPDMLPPTGYGIAARRLLAASERAFVFGGMGSWNDVGFRSPELEARYRAITPALYAAVLAGVAAAVNSFSTPA